MERNNQNNEIHGIKNSRFSPEERARMARESEKYRSSAGNSQQRKRTASQTRTASSDKNRKNRSVAPVSRNERVKTSSENRKKQKKLQNNLIIVMLLVVALAVIGAFASFAMTINTIGVTGSERYSQKTVLEAADLKTGESILLINPASLAHKIESKLPYVEKAEIKRVWPDRVTITLTDAEPSLALDSGKGYILMNSSCKVLDDDAGVVADSALLKGIRAVKVEPGSTAVFSDDISTEDFVKLCKAFEEYGIEDITEYDLTSVSNIKVIIGHRIEVQLGTLAGAPEKLAFCKAVIDKTIASDSKHPMVINVTADGKAYARRKDDSNVIFNNPPAEENTLSEETEASQVPVTEELTTEEESVIAVG